MAPRKAAPSGSSTSIRDFFIPKSRRPADDIPGDEIVLAIPPKLQGSQTPVTQQPTQASPLISPVPTVPRRHDDLQKVRRWTSGSRSSTDSSLSCYKTPEQSPASFDGSNDEPAIVPPDDTHAFSSKSCNDFANSYNINPLKGIEEVGPTKDSPLRGGSVGPSVRVVTSVEETPAALSPSDDASPTVMRPPPQPQPPVGIQAATHSFSSISTLSSLPISSQSSSKRITKNGLAAVTNSDSGTDESSGEELPDVSNFLANKRRKLSPPEDILRTVARPQRRSERSSARQSDQLRQSNTHQPPTPSPPRLSYKHSLAKLVAQNKKWAQSEAKIAELEITVTEAQRQDEIGRAQMTGQEFRASMAFGAADDSDERERLMQALERTEALKKDTGYHFFLDGKPLFDDSSFPVDALPNEPWSDIYRDGTARVHACTSGFAAELASRFPLPIVITNWMATQLLHESDETLCEAYVQILRASCSHMTSISNTLAMLSCFYKTRSLADLGGNSHRSSNVVPPGLKYIMQVVQFCAPVSDSVHNEASPELTKNAFLDLALINLDDAVRSDMTLSTCACECIEGLLDALSETGFPLLVSLAVSDLYASEELTRGIRCRMIAALPGNTVRSYQIRRRLALECFSIVSNGKTSEPHDWASSILQCLKRQPAFAISESTDYALLQDLISVLDLAIAGGFTPYRDLAASQTAQPVGPFGRPAPPSPVEQAHNKQIDAFTQQLQLMASRIRGAGTSHLKRTEAKIAIERLIVRLEHCVRTRPKPRKNVFGGGGGGSGGGGDRQAVVSGFLTKTLQERDEVEVVPFDALSDREDDGEQKDGSLG